MLAEGPLKHTYKVALAELSDAVPMGRRPSVSRNNAASSPARRSTTLEAPLAEIVWCECSLRPTYPNQVLTRHRVNRRVYLLDAAGYALATVEQVSGAAGSVKVLAQHLGVPFHAYRVDTTSPTERKVDEPMFPRRRRCLEIR